MDSDQIAHWIALYLDGKFPGNYKVPNLLLFIDSVRRINPFLLTDEMLKNYQNSEKYELYHNVIQYILKNSSQDKFINLMDMLEIPLDLMIRTA